MNRQPHKAGWQKLVLLYGFIFTVFFALLNIYPPSFFSLVGLKVYDSMVRSLPKKNGSAQPVIIDVDEKSLAQFGQWPWPRYRIALLLDKLRDLGVSSVGLDIIFAEKDRTSLAVLQEEMLRDLGVQAFPEFSGSLPDNDYALSRSLSTGPFVLGYKFFFESRPSLNFLHPFHVIYRKNGVLSLDAPDFFQATAVTTSLPELARPARSSGFVNYPADGDGVLRRVPLLISYGENAYPSLALATLCVAQNINNIFVDMDEQGQVVSLGVGHQKIPVDVKSNILIDYQGKSGFFETYSAADILNNQVSPSQLAGKIVLVGTRAAGLQDTHTTPLDPLYPGVEVHAAIIENIINGHFLSRPPWSRGAEFFIVFLVGVFSTLFLARSRPLTSILFLAFAGSGTWYGSYLLLLKKGIFLQPLCAIVLVIVNFALLSLLKYWREEREVRRRIGELVVAQDTTILSMTALAETRDNETGGHILRTQHYMLALSEHLATHPRFKKYLDGPTIELLYRSAPLHDIGKVGVSDQILLNPGKLTFEEFDKMKEHARYGNDTLEKAESLLKDEKGHTFLRIAREIAFTHHEKWDGSGYPQGLKGDAIPISGRMMAVADVYDALISKRRYKPAYSHENSIEIIKKGRGNHFDPDVVDAFLALEESFRLIALHFADDEKKDSAVPSISKPV